ncbi:uncharacterized protein BX663DRAFT_517994 [Cokeromyces recurvatus]|uniref:uncharacterized protein n=1 Tax=Cokeromyces recurvatus TaxID=90255 RepID=UPI0022208B95|nr:uncharacterized protein BX663DRAFT_517994 [Cokeromyces recurvatus]KAI7900235.1 hypothetical protein BX663DRAFT_517994 [Cokeromyces recurvatus]
MKFIINITSIWFKSILYFCFYIKTIIIGLTSFKKKQHNQEHSKLIPLRKKADCYLGYKPLPATVYHRPSPIKQLPNEILLNIFCRMNVNDLYHCSTVCMRWFELASFSLWRSPVPKSPIFECLPVLLDIDKKYNVQHTHHHHHPSPSSSRISASFPLHLDRVGHLVRSLDLSHIASYITDCTIQHIADYCPYLVDLNLSNCCFITNNSLYHISQSPIAGHLKRLILEGCQQINDIGLDHLQRNCHKIETLSIGRCSGITNKGLVSLVMASESTIRRLYLNECPHVTVAGLHPIIRICGSRLELLDITKMKHIQYEHITDLVEHCPNIRSLTISLKKPACIQELRKQVNETRQTLFDSPHQLVIIEEEKQQETNYADNALAELLGMLNQFNLQLSLSESSTHHSQMLLERQRRRDVASTKAIQIIAFNLKKLEYLNISYC